MIRTQISMTERQAEALRHLAVLRDKSQAAVLRDALDAVVEADLRAIRISRARRAAGAYRSGPSTTSTDHDEALLEAFD
jgi:hypothetical protein